MKPCLLFPSRGIDAAAPLPANAATLTQDLALEPLFAAMADGDEFIDAVSRRVLLAPLLQEGEVIVWRQAVLQDCARQPERLAALRTLAETALTAESRALRGAFSRLPESRLKRACLALRILLPHLRALREQVSELDTFVSPGWQGLRARVQQHLGDDFFDKAEQHLAALAFPAGINLCAGLDADSRPGAHRLYPPEPARPRWQVWLRRLFPARRTAAYSFTIGPRDEAGNRGLSEQRAQGIHEASEVVGALVDNVVAFFTSLRAELAFCQGVLNLQARLKGFGAHCCMPQMVAQPGICDVAGLYDVSLALRLAQPLSGNTVEAAGQALIVITGANQGGKSTFLRSLGQACLMAQAGMPVAARQASLGLLPGLFTHFRREEDRQMKSGKLDEELARLAGLLPDLRAGSLLLMNESFAATNEREGSEIAAEIVRALTEHGVRIVFVTHLYAFASTLQAEGRKGVLFLRAQRLPDGQRSFLLEPGEPLPTAWGEDLYARIFGA
ncbi:MAG: DNA mismatch repair protein MutS [Candidatus Dactylopiibacterium carminicum]|uniref:DNA mismatch repair protein MutS n=1 Tax=Candidatus Dactylopiibacterium carminicum TaxID=857335 RepID=A0A272EN11_9RHOO|nr:DNA mismatch repair protein MutS [Candidatus Dactylopiibacterium carminicum]KAF7597931.1 DNA mismatch repair protein MutS [Candidatus Dactylopiibacterium carminicum]PAS91505.1 MAG: DNA mismatch repair protein MutS [Candidatus Dactylopiibacterium carminicum]PAS93051.1 MAG: DNA mismatch repair protein MutS [Candidatus Dactylopiibacterium carminicum]PAS96031.1 MAG: hypothetical protein BSR46_16080 [Candidatus Dactylopiibacterium carminicum]